MAVAVDACRRVVSAGQLQRRLVLATRSTGSLVPSPPQPHAGPSAPPHLAAHQTPGALHRRC